jgi:hypothetical protein
MTSESGFNIIKQSQCLEPEMGKECYMPYPTFSLDNQLKINGDNIAEIPKSF